MGGAELQAAINRESLATLRWYAEAHRRWRKTTVGVAVRSAGEVPLGSTGGGAGGRRANENDAASQKPNAISGQVAAAKEAASEEELAEASDEVRLSDNTHSLELNTAVSNASTPFQR